MERESVSSAKSFKKIIAWSFSLFHSRFASLADQFFTPGFFTRQFFLNSLLVCHLLCTRLCHFFRSHRLLARLLNLHFFNYLLLLHPKHLIPLRLHGLHTRAVQITMY